MISARKAKELDATTMFTYSHANTPLGQSERAHYLSYFIKCTGRPLETMFCQLYQIQGYHSQRNVRENQNSFYNVRLWRSQGILKFHWAASLRVLNAEIHFDNLTIA